MARSISIVEYKVEQAHFFLEQIGTSERNFFAVQCFTDAFASACRTITFSMQAVITDVDGFSAWYAKRMEPLKKDLLSNFFNAYRVASVHIGDTVVGGGSSFKGRDGRVRMQYFFMPIPGVPSVPATDVLTTCEAHFVNLLTLVYDAFVAFRDQLDDRWYYTEANFNRLGKSFKDAVTDFGFPEQWATAASVLPEPERWRALRGTQTVGCQINALFDRYLGKTIAGPDAG
jgi:hypothetical protein